MTPLERRCRRLMLAYPQTYRRERGEEILGTLLEATPAGRRSPLLRDNRALVAGGLRARAARNRRLSVTTRLRLAVLLGVSIYLGAVAGADLGGLVAISPRVLSHPGGWLPLLAGLLTAAAVLVSWLARRTVIVIAAALAAAAAAASGFWLGSPVLHQTVSVLVSLAVLAVLAGRAQLPPRGWLWLPALAAAASLLEWAAVAYPLGASLGSWPLFLFMVSAPSYLMIFIAVVCAAWVGIDARPALGVIVCLALTGWPTLIRAEIGGGTGLGLALALWPLIAIVLALLAVLALWRPRRRPAL
jgi:hypothetical protein